MAKYKSKPKIIEATQFFVNDPSTHLNVSFGEPLTEWEASHISQAYWVTTIHGQQTVVSDGDWIIQEPDGKHFYPCKPDIFKQSYEPIE